MSKKLRLGAGRRIILSFILLHIAMLLHIAADNARVRHYGIV